MPEHAGRAYSGSDCLPITWIGSILPPLVLAIARIQSRSTILNFAGFPIALWSLTCFRFNWAARKLHKRLCQLGAKDIFPRCEADEQHPEG